MEYRVNLQHSSCKHVFSFRVEKSVVPDQMPTDLNLRCFQKRILDPDQARQNFEPDDDLDSNYLTL